MLVIKLEDHQLGWYVGQNCPVISSRINDVESIQADGHELEHIKDLFGYNNPNIPKGRVVNIFGDLAKTIVANLNNK